MKHTNYIATLLAYTILSLAQNLNITLPSADQPLNLSSSSIDIDYTSTTRYPQLNIWFCGPGFGYSIASNLSTSDSHYTWDPHGVSSALQSTHHDLTESADFYFQATFHEANSSAGAGVPSEQFKVTGYPYMSGAGALRPGLGALILVMVAALSMFL